MHERNQLNRQERQERQVRQERTKNRLEKMQIRCFEKRGMGVSPLPPYSGCKHGRDARATGFSKASKFLFVLAFLATLAVQFLVFGSS
jgi:hypothetical protein